LGTNEEIIFMISYFKIFEFISDEKLKKNLVLDYKEVLTCIKRKAYKGAVVLAGGIVEAILINRALGLSSGDKRRVEKVYLDLVGESTEIEKMDLFYLIKALVNLKIITSPQAGRADVLRDYRNLIHPFKKRDRPTKSDAISVKKLLDDLIIEFGKDVEPKSDNINKAYLFLTHSAYKEKREKPEYKKILELFCKKQGMLTFEELLDLPLFRSKKNPAKSLIANLNYLKQCDLCNYDPNSWQAYPIKRFEKWTMSSDTRNMVAKYLSD